MRKITIETERQAYLPGDAVRGQVIVSTDRPIKARAVKLDIVGAEETQVTVQRGKQSYTYRSSNVIIRGENILLAPSGEDHLDVGPGDYTFRFEFCVPANALPSYRGANAKVVYALKARIDVPMWLDVTCEREIFVFRTRDALVPLSVPASFQSENYEPPTGDKPAFRINLRKRGFVAGEAIEGTITVRNMGSARVRKVDLMLRSQEEAVAQGHEASTARCVHKWAIPADGISEGLPKPFAFPIPGDAPSSYEGVYSSYRWALEANLDIALKFDVSALYPVEILR